MRQDLRPGAIGESSGAADSICMRATGLLEITEAGPDGLHVAKTGSIGEGKSGDAVTERVIDDILPFGRFQGGRAGPKVYIDPWLLCIERSSAPDRYSSSSERRSSAA